MFDAKRFLKEEFGTADAIIGLAGTYAVDVPKRETIRKWFERGSVPGEWWPVMVTLLEKERGKPVGLSGYLINGGEGHDIFN